MGLSLRTLAPDFDVNEALHDEAATLMQRRMRQGMLFFLLAAGGAIWLAFGILTGDRNPHRRR